MGTGTQVSGSGTFTDNTNGQTSAYVGTLIHGELNGHSSTMNGQLELRARATP